MTAYDWCVIAAIAALLAATAWHCSGPEDTSQQPATEPAGRQLDADLAAYRALRDTGIEQQPGDPYSDDRITAELCFIPHQTRRTEEDQ